MAYRTVEGKFWSDPAVVQLTPRGKLLMLYLITNMHSHLSGVYYLPQALITVETGIDDAPSDTPSDTLSASLDTLSRLELAHFYAESSVVYVPKMFKYQGKGEKNNRSAAKQLETLHNPMIIQRFLDDYPKVVQYLSDTVRHTLSIPYPAVGIQEQEQEQEQNQEPQPEKNSASAAAAADLIQNTTRYQMVMTGDISPDKWEPDPATVDRLKIGGIPWNAEMLADYRLYLLDNIKAGTPIKFPEKTFVNWCRKQQRIDEIESATKPTTEEKVTPLWQRQGFAGPDEMMTYENDIATFKNDQALGVNLHLAEPMDPRQNGKQS